VTIDVSGRASLPVQDRHEAGEFTMGWDGRDSLAATSHPACTSSGFSGTLHSDEEARAAPVIACVSRKDSSEKISPLNAGES
jgi:hypothetical protein